MNVNRKIFQFPLDCGQDCAPTLFRDPFDDQTFEPNDMFSEETPPGRWDSPDMPRFHVPGFSHDFPDSSPFGRQSVGSIFANRPRSAFGDIPIKVSHQRSGSGDGSDAESRASGSSDGSTGSARAPKVHHIPIHVETRPQRTANPPQPSQQTAQQPTPAQADVQYRQQDVFPEQQQQQYQQHRQSSPPQDESRYFRSSTPQWREGSPHHFSTLPQFRERTFSDQMSAGKCRPGVRIPVQVERSDSSPVIGEDRFAQRKSPERGPESPVNTGTFPRAKNHEAPLRWMQGLFKGPRASEQSADQQPPPPPQDTNRSPPPPNVQKPSTPQDKIDKVLADLVDLNGKVESFQGTDQKAKDYRFLDEMLTRLMLILDDVITDGNDALRAARKSAIKEVQRVIEKLERIVSANAEAARQKKPINEAPQPEKQQDAVAGPAPAAEHRQREPSPPKRERSPTKKRQASPVKDDKRSPVQKKDVAAVAKARTPSPQKPRQQQQQPQQQQGKPAEAAPSKDAANENQKAGTGGVSVTVNGVPLQAPPEVASAQGSAQAPSSIEVAGSAPKSAQDEAAEEEEEPVVSTASIQLKQK